MKQAAPSPSSPEPKQPQGFSPKEAILVFSVFILVAWFGMEQFGKWEHGEVAPYLDLRPGITLAEAFRQVELPDTHWIMYEDSDLAAYADDYTLVCAEFDHEIPYELPGLPERSAPYYDGVEYRLKALPPINDRVDVIRPALFHVILIYSDPKGTVSLILKCLP